MRRRTPKPSPTAEADARADMARLAAVHRERWHRLGLAPGPSTMTDPQYIAETVWADRLDKARLDRMRAERGDPPLPPVDPAAVRVRLAAEERAAAERRTP